MLMMIDLDSVLTLQTPLKIPSTLHSLTTCWICPALQIRNKSINVLFWKFRNNFIYYEASSFKSDVNRVFMGVAVIPYLGLALQVKHPIVI